MIWFSKRDSNGLVIFSNSQAIPAGTKLKEVEITTSDGGKLSIITDDIDLIKSSRLSRKFVSATMSFYELLNNEYLARMVASNHSIKPIIGQMKQSMGKVVPNALLEENSGYIEQRSAVLEKVKENPEEITDVTIYLKKRITELSLHMLGFELVSLGSSLPMSKQRHNIKKLIMNVWHAFEDEFRDKDIHLYIEIDDNFAEENKVLLDYKTIDLALYNILHNATKYCLDNSKIKFFMDLKDGFIRITIEMLSKRIEKDELEQVFERGYRGVNSKNEEGSGMGLFISKLALRVNQLEIFVQPDYSISKTIDEEKYVINKFYIEGSQ